MAAVDPLFSALADPVRRAMLERLRGGELSAGDLSRPFPISQPAASRHIRVLEEAGLIARRSAGNRRLLRLAPHRLAEFDAWLEPFRAALGASYERLDLILQEESDDDEA